MDHSGHSQPNEAPPTPQNSRKRPIGDLDYVSPNQHKKEAARLRQQRKRERDRAGMMVMSFPPQAGDGESASAPNMSATSQHRQDAVDLTPEEHARRERVRAAARERQRKHRALVKQRKLQELGLDMGNEIMNELELHQRLHPESSYTDVPAMENNGNGLFVGDTADGHTFASTILLSLSCSPLLKQHVIKTLSMTNEDLTQFEPILAHAWNQWDQERRMHFAKQAAMAQASGAEGGPSQAGVPSLPYSVDPSGTSAENFRARFHRSLVTPSPFRAFPDVEEPSSQRKLFRAFPDIDMDKADAVARDPTASPRPDNGSSAENQIDPNLTNHVPDGEAPIDPELGTTKE